MTTATRTLAIATGELLRSRPATRMPGYVALEVVRPCQKTELWHVVVPEGVDKLVKHWSFERGIHCHYVVRETELAPCPMCGSTKGTTTFTDDGLERCRECGCR